MVEFGTALIIEEKEAIDQLGMGPLGFCLLFLFAALLGLFGIVPALVVALFVLPLPGALRRQREKEEEATASTRLVESLSSPDLTVSSFSSYLSQGTVISGPGTSSSSSSSSSSLWSLSLSLAPQIQPSASSTRVQHSPLMGSTLTPCRGQALTLHFLMSGQVYTLSFSHHHHHHHPLHQRTWSTLFRSTRKMGGREQRGQREAEFIYDQASIFGCSRARVCLFVCFLCPFCFLEAPPLCCRSLSTSTCGRSWLLPSNAPS